MNNDLIGLARDCGLGGGVLLGLLVALKALKNGRACPAKEVLDSYHDELNKSKEVSKGLTEAVNRNTAASERLTNVLVEVLTKKEDKP